MARAGAGRSKCWSPRGRTYNTHPRPCHFCRPKPCLEPGCGLKHTPAGGFCKIKWSRQGWGMKVLLPRGAGLVTHTPVRACRVVQNIVWSPGAASNISRLEGFVKYNGPGMGGGGKFWSPRAGLMTPTLVRIICVVQSLARSPGVASNILRLGSFVNKNSQGTGR